MLGWIAAGLLAWSLAEYSVHRFVLHRLKPFRQGHMLHHRDPTADVGVPFVVAAAGFLLAFGAALQAGPDALAFVAGFGIGYLAYVTLHEAMHHDGAGGWLRAHKLRHDLHHRGFARNYGVTSPLWDVVFGTFASSKPRHPRQS